MTLCMKLAKLTTSLIFLALAGCQPDMIEYCQNNPAADAKTCCELDGTARAEEVEACVLGADTFAKKHANIKGADAACEARYNARSVAVSSPLSDPTSNELFDRLEMVVSQYNACHVGAAQYLVRNELQATADVMRDGCHLELGAGGAPTCGPKSTLSH